MIYPQVFLATAGAAVVMSTGAQAKVYFHEDFNSGMDNWVQSEWKPAAEVGEFATEAYKASVDDKDLALKTKDDARFYGLSAKMNGVLNNADKDLVIQYAVTNEQDIDCGGMYLKLLNKGLDQSKYGGESEYSVMFGPDICGSKKTHAILNYARPVGETEAKNMDHTSQIEAKGDTDYHVYQMVIKPDGTYTVKIDGDSVKDGKMAENWPFQPPQEIQDPAESKPEDWVDEAKIPDPEDKKPAGWDDIPRQIPDPEAEMPEDWDEEDDGEWEAPMIDNPDYKGEWSPKLIDNPDYKGPWVHPMIDNPDYFELENEWNVCKDCEYVGLELWQVKSGTAFDDIMITDSVEEADEAAEGLLAKAKEMKEAALKKKAEEEKAAEEEADDEEEEETSEKDEL